MNCDKVYNFILFSEVSDTGGNALDYSDQPNTIWKKVLIMDSIFEFYPSMELIIPDDFGAISDIFTMLEGMRFDAVLADEFYENFLQHAYLAEKNEIIHPKTTTHLSGDILVPMISATSLYDVKDSMAWKNTLSNIVMEVGLKTLKLTPDKLLMVEPTVGLDVWYRINETVKDFFKRITKRAFSQSFATSPFLTFINSAGELYFSSIDKMFLQPPINLTNPYTFSGSEDQAYNPWAIKNFYTIQGGLSTNKENYKKKIFYNTNGVVVEEFSGIEEHITKGKGKVMFRSDIITSMITPSLATDFHDFGIYESKDFSAYKGYKNSLFIDSALYLRMEITIDFNAKAVAGKTILLAITSYIMEKFGVSTEYTGIWLILTSRHLYDSSAAPFTRLVIAKSRIDVGTDNPFANRYLI